MAAASPPPVIVVVDTNEDIAAFLSQVLEDEGYHPVIGDVTDFRAGRQDLATFLAKHQPAAVIWDIAFPYDRNWIYFQRVQTLLVATAGRVILTTTNQRAIEALIGSTPAHEILSKPYDLDQFLATLHRTLADDEPPAPARP